MAGPSDFNQNVAALDRTVTLTAQTTLHVTLASKPGSYLILNLAGQTSHLDSMIDPYTDLEINCRAQLSILEACRHNNPDAKVVFATVSRYPLRPISAPV